MRIEPVEVPLHDIHLTVMSIRRLGQDLFEVEAADGTFHSLSSEDVKIWPQGGAKLGALLARERAAAKGQARAPSSSQQPPRSLLHTNRQEKSRARGASKGTRPLEAPPSMECLGCKMNVAGSRPEHDAGRAAGTCRYPNVKPEGPWSCAGCQLFPIPDSTHPLHNGQVGECRWATTIPRRWAPRVRLGNTRKRPSASSAAAGEVPQEEATAFPSTSSAAAAGEVPQEEATTFIELDAPA